MNFIKTGKISKSITEKAKADIIDTAVKAEFADKAEKEQRLNKSKKKEEKFDMDDEDLDDLDRDDFRDANKKKEDDDDDEKEKKNAKKNEVSRPIICICNDLYAKVLNVLRKEAYVFNIKKANPAKLEKRLKEISQVEGLNIDTSTIKNLSEKSNFDIRVCINTLEFISYNKANIPLLKTISSDKLSLLGRKDISEGIFEIWSKIFSSTERKNYKYIAELYSSYCEDTRINDGLYINYNKVGVSNSTTKDINMVELESRAVLLDYLSYDDILNKKINANQYFELSRFSCLPGLYASKRYTTKERPNLEFPIMLNDFRKSKKANSKILNSLKDCFNDESKSSKINKRDLVLDFLPFIFEIIQPSFRETTLLNVEEKKLIKRAVNIMYSFGIKFNTSEDIEEDSALYEPDIKKFLTYDYLQKPCNYKLTPKQKLILRYEYDAHKNLSDAKRLDLDTAIIANKPSEQKENVKPEEKEKKTFQFNTKRTFTQVFTQDSRFVYKFKEGVTNSVKRSLNINYFK
jgi:DNA polymerase III delta prime subunit